MKVLAQKSSDLPFGSEGVVADDQRAIGLGVDALLATHENTNTKVLFL
jgi:hypothetical protein